MAEPERPVGHQYFESILREREVGALQDQVKQVEALLAMPGWAVLEDVLGKAEKRLLDTMILTGRPLSHEQLTDALGEVRGLRCLDLAVRTLRYVAHDEEQKLRANDEEESRGSQ